MTCDFCYRRCDIAEGGYGICRSRAVKDGKLLSPHYSELCSAALDPVEKKPLYHFHPGTKTLSIAEEGCNFFCSFCQNYEISRHHREHVCIDEDTIVDIALNEGAPSISYTYSEPIVWQDYMLSVAAKAKGKGLMNIMVSNGSFSDESIKRILPFIDAYNIDLKGDERFYNGIVKASAIPVRKGIEKISNYGSYLEVTTMIIEGIHNEGMIREIGRFLSDAGVKVWHLTRFFPSYMMDDRKETSEAYLTRMYEVARQCNIPYIYRGNSISHDDTICPNCGTKIDRYVTNGVCNHCNAVIYGEFI